MVMTLEAKGQLCKTIRALRTRLLEDFKSANDSTYKYAIRRIDQAKLSEANATRRRRIEEWIDEQIRGESSKKSKRTAEDFRRDIEKQAAYTLLNRMLILRLMEAMALRSGDLVAKGWNSEAYKSFRYFSQEIIRGEESEGYAFLLQMVFDDLAIDMPGLYGNVGLSDLIPVPTKTLRAVVEALADPELESCWTDDMTLGWVYQYWNDPEREALDAKVNEGGKIEPHEIASKTQMFTERYMVDWLLQNSLGPIWLAICKKHGWTPLAESTGTLEELNRRRAEWRAKRDAGEVSLTCLMPLNTELEQKWAYYVPRQLPDDALANAPESVKDLRILDPAVGSGHFLVVAFDLLFSLYLEESKHRGEANDQAWSDKSIVESILENNLHGIDLDPRAVQIAAAALWLKARKICRNSHPRYLNLVASNLQLTSLPQNDPAMVELRTLVERETGMPGKLLDRIVQALQGADHLGSLLQIDKAVDEAIARYESTLPVKSGPYVRDLFGSQLETQQKIDFDALAVRESIVEGLERFLKAHTGGDDLGLRTRGHQLASGVRFMRMLREGSYHLVVANPPYQGTSKLKDAGLYEKSYPLGKNDLFAGMTVRAIELLREGGYGALIALSNWMYLSSFTLFRQFVLDHDFVALADFGKAAFSTGGTLISTACYIIRNVKSNDPDSVAIQPMNQNEICRDSDQPIRTEAALRIQRGRFNFRPGLLKVIPDSPVLYSWGEELLSLFGEGKETIGSSCRVRQGLATGDDIRFLLRPWELLPSQCARLTFLEVEDSSTNFRRMPFVPYIKGAAGKRWFEPLDYVIRWSSNGLHKKLYSEHFGSQGGNGVPSEQDYFHEGVAFSTIGSVFGGRLHRYPSIFASTGCTVFAEDVKNICALFNTSLAQKILESFNPTIHFTNNDVERLPVTRVHNKEIVLSNVDLSFSQHESHRETSVEFINPGRSSWISVQAWAQKACDLTEGDPLPELIETFIDPSPAECLSFSIGVALGRFFPDGRGVVDPTVDSVEHALKDGILFLDGTLSDGDDRDGLAQISSAPIREAWAKYGAKIDSKRDLRSWMRLNFFGDLHKPMYDGRPIHLPLSSKNKTFVAWMNIHRMNANTLRSLLADHLYGIAIPRIDGELEDLRRARAEGGKGLDTRFLQLQKWKEELDEFAATVKDCAEKGPNPTDDNCPRREVDARFVPSLEDGVMIISASLWPLLEPQWKEPRKWWKELATSSSKGKKDYDWSHLAMLYFPKRVDEKCQNDPSLGVAHGCFWKYHAAKAWAWELRLQDEIAPDFRIEEASYRGDGGDVEHRAAYLRDHAIEAIATIEKEVLRRRKDAPGKIIQELSILEPGLWSSEPEACWDMETRIIKKQEFGFRLIAPDEAEARAKLIAETPQKETGRRRMLEGKGGSAKYLAGWEEAVENS